MQTGPAAIAKPRLQLYQRQYENYYLEGEVPVASRPLLFDGKIFYQLLWSLAFFYFCLQWFNSLIVEMLSDNIVFKLRFIGFTAP